MSRRPHSSWHLEVQPLTWHSLSFLKLNPLTMTGIYVFIGVLWILSSDHLLALMVPDQATFVRLSTLKGWGYIGVTASLLYSLNRQYAFTLNRSLRALQSSEARLQAILDNSVAAIYVKDLQGRYVLINRYCADLFRHRQAEILGRTDYDLFPLEIAETLRAKDQQALATGQSLQQEEALPLWDGVHTYLTSKFPLCDAAGTAYAVCGISTDISDRKRAEIAVQQLNETLEAQVAQRTAELETANQQLKAINHELDAFSYSVSHDLRAPLRHINGFLTFLVQELEQEGMLSNARVAHYLEVINQSSQKMVTLIESLLSLARIGRQPLRMRPVSLQPLVEAAIALVNLQQSPEPSTVEFVVGSLPTVIGDAPLLQQVFSNLIDNAVKFSHPRSTSEQPLRSPRVEIGSLEDGTLFVKDNGVGFLMTTAEQLFGAFQRLHSQKDFEGTGIGLAIVQRIIHRHGGQIWAESAPNQGATFYFKLTLA